MCLGFPMKVLEGDDITATVERAGVRQTAGMLLVGPQPAGTVVLVHKDMAVRVLDPDEVPLLEDALQALEAAHRGDSVEGYFSDLSAREPMLPEHLRKGVP